MNILMITRKIDREDALAGFAYGWIKKMAEELRTRTKDPNSKLYVICLEKGDISDLPDNTEIFSLGKETGVNRYGRFVEFQKLAQKLVPKANGIFCHMNPEYTINIWPYAKFFHKKIVSWYTHGKITWKVRLMEKMADSILTASEDSFTLPSKKKKIIGHGIDTETFKPLLREARDSSYAATPEGDQKNILKILTVGRISPTKDVESLIKAVDILHKEGIKNIRLKIVGAPPLSKHFPYYESLRQMVRRMELESMIEFIGPVPNKDVAAYYQDADLFINLSGTASIDKAVLEAMACGCMALTSNSAFRSLLPERLIIPKNNPRELASRILLLSRLMAQERETIQRRLREIVVQNHNLENLIKKIMECF